MVDRLRRIWASRPTLGVELENKGSVARDHLASERTFLAWMRTSLSLVSLGIAIAQLFKLPELVEPDEDDKGGSESVRSAAAGPRGLLWQTRGATDQPLYTQQDFAQTMGIGQLASLEKLGKPLGAACIALGAVCLMLGAYRYYLVQSHLMRGVFAPSRIEVSFMSLFVGVFVVAAFGIIVGVRLQT